MRLPVIPIVVMILVLGAAIGVFLLSRPTEPTLGAPITSALIDVDGIETEVAVAPDGLRYALIASGDLWFVDLGTDSRKQLTATEERESAPAWTGDGRRITFTRGGDTLEVDPSEGVETPRLNNARDLEWSAASGQMTFVRDRALWVARPDGTDAREIVPADPILDVSLRSPRFSPSGRQILFLKSRLGLYGEVWRVDLETGATYPVIADRPTENPTSAEWVGDDDHLVYLTDRSGGLAVWYADLDAATLLPLTSPMMVRALDRPGLDVHEDRVILPRHTVDSDITTLDRDLIVGGPGLQMEPAASPDGRHIAFTQEADGGFQIWMMDRETGDVRYVAPGRHPRFSPDGNQIVYAFSGLEGSRNIWKTDVRTGLQEPLTDGAEIDDLPDWAPDGRSIVFTSDRDGELALWSVPASGGRRRRLNDRGYAPRFSAEGTRIAYWSDGAIWTAASDGGNPERVADAEKPVPPVWLPSGPAFYTHLSTGSGIESPDGNLLGALMWPEFDRSAEVDPLAENPNDSWLISSLEIGATELWSLQLTYEEE